MKSETNFHLTVEIPSEDAYLATNIIKNIAAQKYPCEYDFTCKFCNDISADGNSYVGYREPCPVIVGAPDINPHAHRNTTRDLRFAFERALIEQLHKLVNNCLFDLWNEALDQTDPRKVGIRNATITYGNDKIYVEREYILQADLVEFCRRKRIKIIFDGDDDDTEAQIEALRGSQFTFSKNDGSSGANIGKALPTQPTLDSQTELELPVDNPPAKKYSGKKKSLPVKVQSEQKALHTDEEPKTFDDLPDSGCINIDKLAALFDCSKRTIQRRVDKGELPKPHKFGGTNRFNVGEIRKTLPA